VTRCLSAVFEEPYEFKILFVQKRGRTEAKMIFERNGHEVDPLTASGGGVVDLAALALRLACIKLLRPAPRAVLIFDEPFKSPSPRYRERVKLLMETLATEMGVQFIFVTNIMELATGNIIDIDAIPKAISPSTESVKRRLRGRRTTPA
jgi:ABC-type thiamine transport system ATPase subunit